MFLVLLVPSVLLEQPAKLARQGRSVLLAQTERAQRVLPVLRVVWELPAQPVFKEQPVRLELLELRVRQGRKVIQALPALPAQQAFKV